MKPRPTDGIAQPRLFPAEPFGGFGPSLYRPADESVSSRQVRARGMKLQTGVRDQAPPAPGVYGMINARGRIIYVGKAKNLRCRLLSYFRVHSREAKAGRIIRETRILVWEQTGDELAALLRELELIQTLRPKFNVLGIPGRQRHHYLCIGKSPAPHVYVSTKPSGTERGIYGPLVVREKSEEAARRLNDWFQLRDCPQTVPLTFADQPELFPDARSARCLRFELGSCHGPCLSACTARDYSSSVRAAKAFLDGRDRTILREVTRRMAAAAAALEFEKALAMRDRLEALEWLDSRLALLRQARDRQSFVYPLCGDDGRTRWYLIHRGQVRAVCFVPTADDECSRAARLLESTFSRGAGPAVLGGGAVDSVLLVLGWFRKNAGERGKLLTQAEAVKWLNHRPRRPA